MNCELAASGVVQRLDSAVELGIFRIAQEAVGNAIKHARARRVSIELVFAPGVVKLRVTDDGSGIPEHSHVVAKGGYGLSAMGERARQIGGTFVLATPPGGGTMISLSVLT